MAIVGKTHIGNCLLYTSIKGSSRFQILIKLKRFEGDEDFAAALGERLREFHVDGVRAILEINPANMF